MVENRGQILVPVENKIQIPLPCENKTQISVPEIRLFSLISYVMVDKNKLFAMLPGKLHYNGLLCMQELNLGSLKFLSHL